MASIPGLEHFEENGWEIVRFDNVSEEEYFVGDGGRIEQWVCNSASPTKQLIIRKVQKPKHAKQSWTPKVGDWVKVTKPVDCAPAHKIWWIEDMDRFDRQVMRVTSVCEQRHWAKLSNQFAWEFDFAWLLPATDPTGQPAPPKQYREPTQADLANGPIQCEYRDDDDEQWRNGLLVYILNGVMPYLCTDEWEEFSGQWAQCQIEVSRAIPDLPINEPTANPADKQPPSGYQWIECGQELINGDFSVERKGNIELIPSCIVGLRVGGKRLFIRKIEEPPEQYRQPTLADLANGPIECEVRQGMLQLWETTTLIYVFSENLQPFITAFNGSIRLSPLCRIREK